MSENFDLIAIPKTIASIALHKVTIVIVVFSCAAVSIYFTPTDFKLLFWPANAVVLGFMIRDPSRATPASWGSAFIGYIAAGMLANQNILIALWLAAAHMSAVIVGYLFLVRLSPDDRRLRRPFSIVYLCLACITGAAAAGAMGSAPAIVLAYGGIQTSIQFCFISEFANSVILLPMILTAPNRPLVALRNVARKIFSGQELYDLLPILALGLTIVASVIVEGPGAFAYPVPALVWCALRYDLFSVAILTFLFSIWPMFFLSSGLYPSAQQTINIDEITSLRLAIGLIALGPLAVASMNNTRNELIAKLRHAASHDFLTNTLSRSDLMSRGNSILKTDHANCRPTTVIMLDIDHFKNVNDQHGHAAGDAVLVEFANRVAKTLRKDDVFGRLGGEEFVVILPGVGFFDGLNIAERVRTVVEEPEMLLPSGQRLRITVSGGVVVRQDQLDTLDSLLRRADQALYTAKARGRNIIHNTHNTDVAPALRSLEATGWA